MLFFAWAAQEQRRGDPGVADAAVVLEHVSLSFDGVRALDDISCEFAADTVAGLAGPDGAGKTSILRLAVGLLRPDAGRVRVLGRLLPQETAAIRNQVGYLPQRTGTLSHLTVRENLEYFGDLNGVPRNTMRSRIADLLSLTGLEPFQDRLAQHLSGGMRQKLSLACAMLHRPRLILLDEPSTGLDPISRRDLWELIYAFQADGGSAVVATPSWEEAGRCQEVVIVEGGRVLAAGQPSKLAQAAEGHVWEAALLPGIEEKLARLSLVVSARRHGPLVRLVVDRRMHADAVVSALSHVAPRTDVQPAEPTLEDAMVLFARARRGQNPEQAESDPASGERTNGR